MHLEVLGELYHSKIEDANTPSNQICQCQCGALHGTCMVLSQGLNNCGVTNK
jgi:hypothetical protein